MTWTKFLSPEGRDALFDVLVHVVWADGRLTPDEIAAARGAALALGISASAISGGLVAREGRPFESLPLGGLGPLERPFVYGAAAWISMADRHVAVSENVVLGRLRRALSISGPFAGTIESWAREERSDAREALEHAMELERVMCRVVRHLVGGPDEARAGTAATTGSPTQPPEAGPHARNRADA